MSHKKLTNELKKSSIFQKMTLVKKLGHLKKGDLRAQEVGSIYLHKIGEYEISTPLVVHFVKKWKKCEKM